MKTASQLAATPFTSSRELSRRATSLKGTTTALQNQLKADLDLTDKEKKTLAEAVALLGRLADAHAKAGSIKKKATDETAAQEKGMRALLDKTFGKLSAVADKTAFVAFVYRHHADKGFERRDLDYHFGEALYGLVYRLARAEAGTTPETRAADEWRRFETERPRLQERYATLIEALSGERAKSAVLAQPGSALHG